MTGHVFISYSQADRAYAERLAAYLTQNGIPVWFDYQITVGSRFDAEIQEKIDGCVALVLVMTPVSVDSIWVSREIGYADDHRKPIFPLILTPSKAPLRLQSLQHEEVTGGRMPSAAFVARLRALTSPGAAPAPAPGVPKAAPAAPPPQVAYQAPPPYPGPPAYATPRAAPPMTAPKSNTGLIIGIVAGAVALLCVLGGIIYLATRPPGGTPPGSGSGRLDPNLTANYGGVSAQTGFSPDPISRSITSGGSISVSYLSNCRGYATAAPDLELQWSGTGAYLRFLFVASGDTTLIINAPNGDWYCADDSFGNNPAIDFGSAQSGVYDIWIGSYTAGQNVSGTLHISGFAITP